MPRRRSPEKRKVLPDPKYKDVILAKFMNNLMKDGKKSVAEKIVYGAFDQITKTSKDNPLEIFMKALEEVSPVVEVKSRRVGGVYDAANRNVAATISARKDESRS